MDYKEDCDAGLKILKDERGMREKVFKNDTMKRRKKVAEMDVCINLLRNYKKTLPSRCGNLFGKEGEEGNGMERR